MWIRAKYIGYTYFKEYINIKSYRLLSPFLGGVNETLWWLHQPSLFELASFVPPDRFSDLFSRNQSPGPWGDWRNPQVQCQQVTLLAKLCDKTRCKCAGWSRSHWVALHIPLVCLRPYPATSGASSPTRPFLRWGGRSHVSPLLGSAVSWDPLKRTGSPAPTVLTAKGSALPACSAGSPGLRRQPCLSGHISIRQHGKLVIFIYCLQFMAASILPPAHLKRKGKKSTPIFSKCLYSRSVCFREGGRDVGIFIVCEGSLGGLQLEK